MSRSVPFRPLQHNYSIQLTAVSSDMDKYPGKQHICSILEHLKAKDGLICLPGSLLPNWEDSDQAKPFRQRRYFYYVTGCNEPGCYVTYDIAHDFLTLYIPPINPPAVIWNGRGSTIEEAKHKYDVDDVKLTSILHEDFSNWTKKNSESTVYFLHPRPDAYLSHTSKDTESHVRALETTSDTSIAPTPVLPNQKSLVLPPVSHETPISPTTASPLKKRPTINSTSLLPAMNAARTIKSPTELTLIRRANVISATAHKKVLSSIKSFTNERQIAGTFFGSCYADGAPNQAYDIIAGSGPNAATLHYTKNDEPLKGRQLVCLDAGAEYENYASDVTRTFPISGSFTQEARDIYSIVEKMQEECIAMIKPGVHYRDIFFHSEAVALEGLMALGVLHNGSAEEILAAHAVSIFFPHGLGHHIGLEVHDVSAVPLLRYQALPGATWYYVARPDDVDKATTENTETGSATQTTETAQPLDILQPNMVLTVEPGIYFSKYSIEYYQQHNDLRLRYVDLDVVEKYYAVGGVRIEDDILVTEGGYENLTSAPKGEEMLRIIREGE